MRKIYDFTIEYQVNPIEMDIFNPRFSWKFKSEEQGVMQRFKLGGHF